MKNLKDGFPPDEEPSTDSYEFLSESDRLDEVEGGTGVDESPNDDTVASHPAFEKGSTQARRTLPLAIGRDAEQATAIADDSGTTHNRGRWQLSGKWRLQCEPRSQQTAQPTSNRCSVSRQALLYYIYTGEICFAPFGSEASRGYRASEKPDWEMDDPQIFSPKSIYTGLADKVTQLQLAVLK